MKVARLSQLAALAACPLALAALAATPASALAGGGTLLALGSDGNGELGYPSEAGESASAEAAELPAEIAGAAQGREFSLAFTSAGKLYGFGNGVEGELGEACGAPEDEVAPRTIEVGGGEKVVQVAAGANFSLAVTAAGKLYSFGNDKQKQLGRALPEKQESSCLPGQVQLPEGAGPVVEAAAGDEFALVRTESGKVYGFGSNTKDELTEHTNEHGELVTVQTEPFEIALEETALQVAAGGASGYVLTAAHHIIVFGDDASGQVGPPPPEAKVVARATEIEPSEKIEQIAAGGEFALARTADGQVLSFGNDELGQLGRKVAEEAEEEPIPAAVEFTAGTPPITSIAAGQDFAVAVDSTGHVWGWGEDMEGELGSPEKHEFIPDPLAIALPEGDLVGQAADGPAGSQTLLITSSTAKKLVPTLEIEPPGASFQGARVGRRFSGQLYATGGKKPYTWSWSPTPKAPPGLALAPGTGLISGTPQLAGSYEIAVKVTDSEGRTATRTIRLDIEREKPPEITELSESTRLWRESSRLPRIARAKPRVGTEFFFNLSVPSRVTLTFCRIRGRGCKSAGSFAFERRQGFASVRFYGRLSARRRLVPGRYKVSFKAKDAAGARSGGVLSFQIVR
ncbi:MAG TPA: putative Ig domain-containing protein [Solirubrobacteraceae bacterium]|nr:putative Ig domain-containing protein [Solirubrobacteraceae bacterium]